MALYLNRFGLVRAARELTYGTHPDTGGGGPGSEVLADFNAEYVEDFQAGETYDPITRTGKSKERPGWASQTGLRTPTFTGRVEILPVSLYKFNYDPTVDEHDVNNDGNSEESGGAVTVTEHGGPKGVAWLRACGFIVDDTLSQEGKTGGADPAQDAILVMKPDVFSAPSVTIENLIRKYATSETYMRETLLGCRANASLVVETGQRLMLELEGGAKSFVVDDYTPGSPLDPIFNDYGVVNDGTNNGVTDDENAANRSARLPFAGINATTTIDSFDSAGNPIAFTGGVHSLRVDLNNGLTYPRVMDEDGSVSEVILAPTEPMSCNIRMEAEAIASWDIYDIVANKREVTVTTTFTDRETGTDTLALIFTCRLETVEPEEVDNRLVWNCSGSIAYENQGQPFGAGVEPLLQLKWTTPYV